MESQDTYQLDQVLLLGRYLEMFNDALQKIQKDEKEVALVDRLAMPLDAAWKKPAQSVPELHGIAKRLGLYLHELLLEVNVPGYRARNVFVLLSKHATLQQDDLVCAIPGYHPFQS